MATSYEHIAVEDDGNAVIAETGMKVTQLIAEVMAYGWSPEELCFQHRNLSMGQIHSALAYYWDHKKEVEAQIEADLQYAEALRQRLGESSLVAKLKAKGLL
jgi:uncharacterized protein (DUF433 family)